MTNTTSPAESIGAPSGAASFYRWEVAGKPIPILFSLDLMDRLEREVLESFKAVTKRGSEIGGVLGGRCHRRQPADGDHRAFRSGGVRLLARAAVPAVRRRQGTDEAGDRAHRQRRRRPLGRGFLPQQHASGTRSGRRGSGCRQGVLLRPEQRFPSGPAVRHETQRGRVLLLGKRPGSRSQLPRVSLQASRTRQELLAVHRRRPRAAGRQGTPGDAETRRASGPAGGVEARRAEAGGWSLPRGAKSRFLLPRRRP